MSHLVLSPMKVQRELIVIVWFTCIIHMIFLGVLVLSSSCFADFSSFTIIALISWLLLSFIATFIKTVLWGLSLLLFVYTSRFAEIYGAASKEFS